MIIVMNIMMMNIIISPLPRRNMLMKVSREQVQLNRERILATASRLFRERGFDGVSVADVMKAAGLTHGGFYGHFDSKDALIREALGYEPPARDRRANAKSTAEYADAYLSPAHRDNRGAGCPVAGLGSEAARASAEIRAPLVKAIRRQIDRFSMDSPGNTPAQRRRAAITAYSAMVGAMVLARIVDDEELSQEILGAARKSIRFHAGPPLR
jgi:TetR/AcrR family transcriptional regulator, transcriptional repressor for nem operon